VSLLQAESGNSENSSGKCTHPKNPNMNRAHANIKATETTVILRNVCVPPFFYNFHPFAILIVATAMVFVLTYFLP